MKDRKRIYDKNNIQLLGNDVNKFFVHNKQRHKEKKLEKMKEEIESRKQLKKLKQ